MQDVTQTQHKKIIWSLISVAVIFVVSLTVFVLFSDDMPSAKLGGEDGKLGGEFTLSSPQGEVSLSDFRGKVVLIYFGFTSCKYVCPNSMTTIKNTLDRLEDKELENIQALFVSVDPARDTHEKLQAYSKKYHSNIIGLRGEKEQIDVLVNEYGAYYRPEDPDAKAFRHSSRYYLVNQKGELVDAMRHSSTPNELIARIRKLI